MTIADDSLIAGKIYTFRWYAKNYFGNGERSDEVTIALAAYPLATTNIRKVMTLSSKTSIALDWDPITPGVSPAGDILGYVLEAKDSVNGTVWQPFNGVKMALRD